MLRIPGTSFLALGMAILAGLSVGWRFAASNWPSTCLARPPMGVAMW